jgi:hypothetical protein
MRIRFLVSIASVENWSYGPGNEAEFPDEQAQSFIAGGIAEVVTPETSLTPVTATELAIDAAPIETATDTHDVAPSTMPSSPSTKKKGK